MPTNGIYKILIVDDSVSVVRTLQQSLSRRPQFFCLVAYDAEEGINLVKRELPDIVLLDISLPGMNGLEACRLLKKEYPALPIIIMTGEIDPANRVKAYDAGANDFLSKPFTPEQTIAHVRHHLHLSALDILTI